jgi:hypothetical protein
MSRCKYCTEDFDGFKTVLDKNGHATIQQMHMSGEPIIRIMAFSKMWEFKINFCPMCGRRLSKDAGTD